MKSNNVVRYRDDAPVDYLIEDPEGEYVSYCDYNKILKALEYTIKALNKIANEDFRGNRSPSSVDAYNTLKELNEIK